MFLEATNAVGRRAERIVAAEQNLRCWDARRKRRPVRLERHIVMELAHVVINAVRRLIGKRVAAGNTMTVLLKVLWRRFFNSANARPARRPSLVAVESSGSAWSLRPRLEFGEPAGETGELVRRQLGNGFGDFFDFHGAQYGTAVLI